MKNLGLGLFKIRLGFGKAVKYLSLENFRLYGIYPVLDVFGKSCTRNSNTDQ